jgi:hypothetical protein
VVGVADDGSFWSVDDDVDVFRNLRRREDEALLFPLDSPPPAPAPPPLLLGTAVAPATDG